ncbi:hypothetical protein D1007_31065 [Hordeum vulgare]|nr:hypothetical protein D1007_31065 [Hordeum vulgare]
MPSHDSACPAHAVGSGGLGRAAVLLMLTVRLGAHDPQDEHDARRRLEWLAESFLLEEEGPLDPAYFGPCIRREPFPSGFMLPRDTLKDNGSAKTED